MIIENYKQLAFFLCFLFAYNAQNLQSLPGGSIVFSEIRGVRVEALAAGDVVTSYNQNDGSFSNVTVQQNSKFDADSIVEIKTSKGSILSAPAQLFYDDAKQDFVRADAITDQSVLFSRSLGKISCLGTIQHVIKTTCYELVLEWPHLFFATDLELLMHNYAQLLSTALEVAPKVIAEIRATFPVVAPSLQRLFDIGRMVSVVELVREQYIKKAGKPLEVVKATSLPSLEIMEERLLRDVGAFQRQYVGRNRTFDPDKYAVLGRPVSSSPPAIIGISPDPRIYHDICCNSVKFGPMFPLGVMLPTGDVLCVLYVMTFSHWEPMQPVFEWRKFGDQILKRSDPYVKTFVEFEDKTVLGQLKDFIKTWPLAVTKSLSRQAEHTSFEAMLICAEYGNFERAVYGRMFGVHALYQMSQKSIPPSLVLQAIKNAKCVATKDPARIIISDQPLDVAVVVEKSTGKVINAGKAKDATAMNEMPPEDDPDDDKEDNDDEDDNDAAYNSPEGAATRKNFEAQTENGLRRSLASVKKNRIEHIEKLAEYRKNPYVHDNKNLLKNASTSALKKQVYKTRVHELKTQIRRHKWQSFIIKSILKKRGFKS